MMDPADYADAFTNIPPLPWQEDAWQRLMQLKDSERLPHALLFNGAMGLGKTHCALSFSAALLCRDSSRQPCGECKSCLLFSVGNHPDYLHIEPAETGKAIRIDQIRAVSNFFSQTAQQGGRKCVVIAPADAMNINAANALLKSLEEPPAGSVLLLITAAPSRISATIRSRCQMIAFHGPDTSTALRWLREQLSSRNDKLTEESLQSLLSQAHGSPLLALKLNEEGYLEQNHQIAKQLLELADGHTVLTEVGKRWLAFDSLAVIDTLLGWIVTAGKQLLASDVTNNKEPGASAQVVGGSEKLSSRLLSVNPLELFQFQDRLLQTKTLLLSSANPNPQLLWEGLLLDWIKLCKSV